MNLDRFSQPLAGENEKPTGQEVACHCEYCEEPLHTGQKVFRFEGKTFCDTICLFDYNMIEKVTL
ncbi:hypothetical protein Q9R38_26185 [Priestia aryabhattai]|uniref:hypothetical protein n=1 Tax=Priestia aryabhattai TaxID=412384 RepID=UPI0028815F21|nr:hypothetical protein [Priestia aryabhattai]MDT0150034.1 hypothetical protein [Priestia aryabhattai]MDT0155604.1 hypothetical protein [Priestia aryabhattai]